jgi:hypothetical protein
MTPLLEEAIGRLQQLPEPMQDCAARAVLLLLEEDEAESRDQETFMHAETRSLLNR